MQLFGCRGRLSTCRLCPLYVSLQFFATTQSMSLRNFAMTHSVSLRIFSTTPLETVLRGLLLTVVQLFLCTIRMYCLCLCPQYYTKQAWFFENGTFFAFFFTVKGLFSSSFFSREFFNFFLLLFFNPV